jgi:hypothetical protein
MLPLLDRIGFIVFDQQAANQPLDSSQFLSRFPTAVHIMQHIYISKLVLLHRKPKHTIRLHDMG